MQLTDTHCHLYLEDFDADRNALIRAARDSGIDKILLPNIDLSTIDRMQELADREPAFAYPMMGLHPTSVGRDYAAVLRQMESLLHRGKYCAIGETGIDLYWDKTYLKEQKEAFEEQLRWSAAMDLPVVIHARNAFPEVLESIHKTVGDKIRGVFHSFSGTESDVREISKLKNIKLGINGIITYKNSGLPEVIIHADIENIVLETDAPYLPPVPYRGKRNEPVYIWKTAEKVSAVYGLPVEETVRTIRKNTYELFNL
ncbi:MAG: TatD family hydrolase [Bacteroidales bacterium]